MRPCGTMLRGILYRNRVARFTPDLGLIFPMHIHRRRYFLEPVVLAVNYGKALGYKHIVANCNRNAGIYSFELPENAEGMRNCP